VQYLQGFTTYTYFAYTAIIYATLFCDRIAIAFTGAWFLLVQTVYFFAIIPNVPPEMTGVAKVAEYLHRTDEHSGMAHSDGHAECQPASVQFCEGY